jgi:LuxR family maltose regulon positive regulatory protein
MVAKLDAVLLEAKLSVPHLRPRSIRRAELIEAARASDCRVVGITAPAGYGKSTLLTQWALTEDRRVMWVSLDRLDDDPAILLTLLAYAYARASSSYPDVSVDIGGLGMSVLGRAAPRLASVLRTSPFSFALMLDDLQELRSPACHDVLGVVISGIPRNSQLIAASRSEQPHVPRLRASGDALEFVASDLALDASGAQQIFSEAHVDLSPDLAAVVVERTEGWPVGLYLAALIASDSKGDAVSVSGEDPYVADYLYRESLINLSEDSQRFLRRTAVLDQLCGPLCDSILGGSDAYQQIRDLEALNMFLIPLDRRREWYRYHALFREFLLGELRRVEPDVITKLHLRAADWYGTNGSSVMAVEHLLNTAERDRCARLMSALALQVYQAGQMATLKRWLSALGDAAIKDYPPLAVVAGWLAVIDGQTDEAERWAAIADASTFDLVPEDGTASFDSARAMLRAAMCAAGPNQMMTDASFAVAQEPSWSAWRDLALCLLAEAHLLTGDIEQALALFTESSTLAAALGNTDNAVDSEAELAIVAMDRGHWEESAEHLDLALALIDKLGMHDYATSVLAFAGAARLSLHRGDAQEANRQLARAMRARPSCTFVLLPFLAVRVRLQLAKVYFAMSDATTARHLLREIDDILQHRPALGVLVEEVSEFRRLLESSTQAGVIGVPPLTPAELRLLPYLQTHLTFRDIGERLFVSRNTVNSEIRSIYRKLGVSSRSEAVQEATRIGLLGA